MLTVGSLFSGIGGIDLGLERAGMQVRWQVEIDPWCNKVLAKHWPDVERFADVREVGANNLQQVDVIAGGFPCQDISVAGHGVGIGGARSGLWSEYARIIRELRPDTSSWKMSQLSWLGDLGSSSVIWPRAGMTRSGIAYRLPPLAPLTAATDSGSWPTPRAQDAKHGQVTDYELLAREKMWPTPTARDHKDTGQNLNWEAIAAKSRLAGVVQVREKWPTPRTSDANGPGRHGDGGPDLRTVVSETAATGGQLNPQWVEWLMGYPSGWTDLGDSGTRSSRRSSSGSAGASSKRRR